MQKKLQILTTREHPKTQKKKAEGEKKKEERLQGTRFDAQDYRIGVTGGWGTEKGELQTDREKELMEGTHLKRKQTRQTVQRSRSLHDERQEKRRG